ncbi:MULTISPECIES: hypothetical protein [unclassified Spirosoma]|uniref:hypothetical protein n=1 Tax=unclassified Spirosoma TaxID=2621999 RepID=UPI0009694315|nr:MULTISPECIES: hypothetical protein [unclassified Spirosoma]MBN8823208.1 hypothetical protein [Spirosoma sp.]OJW72642.1 MAG: hypothetical protein BGO59_16120 [Spirosoma sp. 48-14]
MSQEFRAFAAIEDAIDTSESYRGSLVVREDSILVPIINLGISEHVLNPTNKLAYVDFAYLFFKGFSKVLLNSFTDIKSKDTEKRYCYVGGSQAGDLEVECNQTYLLLPTAGRLSPTNWYPDNTPFYKANLDSEQVNSFWNTVDAVWKAINSLK